MSGETGETPSQEIQKIAVGPEPTPETTPDTPPPASIPPEETADARSEMERIHEQLVAAAEQAAVPDSEISGATSKNEAVPTHQVPLDELLDRAQKKPTLLSALKGIFRMFFGKH